MILERFELTAGGMSFSLCATGKYNFVLGYSGTGKTALSTLLNKIRHGLSFHYTGEFPLYQFSDARDYNFLKVNKSRCVIFIDEEDWALFRKPRNYDREWLENSNHIFIIVARDLPSDLPFGANNIFTFSRRNRKVRMIPKYTDTDFQIGTVTKGTIVCEDASAGSEYI